MSHLNNEQNTRLQDIACSNSDLYQCTIANLRLLEYYLTQNDFGSCRFYLLRAQEFCQENRFDELFITFHNLAGQYYQDIFDEQTAMKHYLQGLELSRKQMNKAAESKILNNIGTCFRRRHDNPSAANYFHLAYELMEQHIKPENADDAVNFLCNYAEACQYMKKEEDSHMALILADSLNHHSQASEFRLAYAWCGHYALVGSDPQSSISIASKLLDDGLGGYSDIRFKIGAFMELSSYMLILNCQELALRCIKLLKPYCSFDNLGDYYHCQILRTQYYERFGTEEECNEVYREFYKSSMKINQIDDTMRVQNVLSNLDLTQALLNRDTLRQENKALENASYIDELTQLYNWRYLSKTLGSLSVDGRKKRVGFIMLDVDYFKQYNDYYGHFMGDGALQSVADTLKKHSQDNLYASRYGGDEFLILCINMSDQKIEDHIRQIQADLSDKQIPHEKSKCADHLTLSIGYSNGLLTTENSSKELLEAADQALYRAKEQGRDCFAGMVQ